MISKIKTEIEKMIGNCFYTDGDGGNDASIEEFCDMMNELLEKEYTTDTNNIYDENGDVVIKFTFRALNDEEIIKYDYLALSEEEEDNNNWHLNYGILIGAEYMEKELS